MVFGVGVVGGEGEVDNLLREVQCVERNRSRIVLQLLTNLDSVRVH